MELVHLHHFAHNGVFFQNLAQPSLIGISDKNLPKMMLPYHVEQLRNTKIIQFVENII